jgi:hypothetical protein
LGFGLCALPPRPDIEQAIANELRLEYPADVADAILKRAIRHRDRIDIMAGVGSKMIH